MGATLIFPGSTPEGEPYAEAARPRGERVRRAFVCGKAAFVKFGG